MNHLNVIAVCIGVLVGGCSQKAAEPVVSAGEPLGLQMVRTEAQLKKYPFRTLLEFEASTDPVFVKVEGEKGKIDRRRKHTGEGSLIIERGSKAMAVRVDLLFSGSAFPGRWALAGAYFYAERPQRLGAVYEVQGTAVAGVNVQIPGGQWTPVMLDVAAGTEGKQLPIGVLRFVFDGGLGQAVWCDDVLVMDNTQVVVDSGWVIRERGFEFVVEKAGVFTVAMKTPEASDQGWRLEEAGAVRARFASKGKEKSCTIYSDGRRIVDGKMTLLGGANAAAIEHHPNPGQVSIATEMGRVDRNSAEDLNNDGYSELTGAYQIVAAAPRIELTLAPQAKPLYCPVLEISGLPAGNVLVNMEGRVVETTARLANARLLVVLPGTLTRPTLVSLRVSQ
ncbi:MAG: hypothetical protein NTU53_17350 [Planctomycetota bacterium]|nr:hypothetical protein [Planctomycetota bacterium]